MGWEVLDWLLGICSILFVHYIFAVGIVRCMQTLEQRISAPVYVMVSGPLWVLYIYFLVTMTLGFVLVVGQLTLLQLGFHGMKEAYNLSYHMTREHGWLLWGGFHVYASVMCTNLHKISFFDIVTTIGGLPNASSIPLVVRALLTTIIGLLQMDALLRLMRKLWLQVK